jgi:glycosyltransferase involved in cell wall biosynthesis
MNITYDYQIFAWQKTGGISRYFFELMQGIKKHSDHSTTLGLWYSENHYISEAPFFCPIISKAPNFKGKHLVVEWVNRWKMKQAIINSSFDLFHPTYYNPYFLKSIGRRPYVVTVYDMVHEFFPEEVFDRANITSKWKEILVQNAAGIIAISERTKQDLVNIFHLHEKKIRVIYLASSLHSNDSTHRQPIHLPPCKYILYVGEREGYKNFRFFIISSIPFFKKNKELKVVCIGGKPFSKNEIHLIQQAGLTSRIFRYVVSEKQLSAMYENAELLMVPSLYEGFGLPLLEGFSCNCPVVCSTKGALPEVGGDAPVYFDPTNPGSLLEAIEFVFNNESIKKEMRKRGKARAELFSWDNTVRETLELYQSVVN